MSFLSGRLIPPCEAHLFATKEAAWPGPVVGRAQRHETDSGEQNRHQLHCRRSSTGQQPEHRGQERSFSNLPAGRPVHAARSRDRLLPISHLRSLIPTIWR
jgi:hypothetical protein